MPPVNKTDTSVVEDLQVVEDTPVADTQVVEDILSTAPVNESPAVEESTVVKNQSVKEAPATSSMKFAPEASPATEDDRTYVTAEVDENGHTVTKKYLIGGRHFGINGKDYIDKDLAQPENRAIIDGWLANKSAILKEVFE